MADWGCEFSFFQGIHVRIGIRIDTSISIRPMIPNLLSRYIYRIWLKWDKSAGAGDIIKSRSRDKLKTLYLHYTLSQYPGGTAWPTGENVKFSEVSRGKIWRQFFCRSDINETDRGWYENSARWTDKYQVRPKT